MTTVTKALDHLTDVLAGSDVTLKGTKADCIMQLADMIEDGTIVIGGGGGSDVFVVNFSINDFVYSADKTFAEIVAAREAGKVILGCYDGNSVMLFQGGSAEDGLKFNNYDMDSEGGFYFFALVVAADDSVTAIQGDYDLSSLAE